MDDTGGMYGAMCALTGLYDRNMTRRGQLANRRRASLNYLKLLERVKGIEPSS
jgi:hypothetical protein